MERELATGLRSFTRNTINEHIATLDKAYRDYMTKLRNARDIAAIPNMNSGNSAHEASPRGKRTRKVRKKARRGGIKETRSATRGRLRDMGENSASASK